MCPISVRFLFINKSLATQLFDYYLQPVYAYSLLWSGFGGFKYKYILVVLEPRLSVLLL